MCRYIINPYRQTNPRWDEQSAGKFYASDILEIHQSIAEYRPTPFFALPTLARQLGVGRVLVKDEAERFGLKAFKALGATYAIYRLLRGYLEVLGRPCPRPGDFYRQADLIDPASFTFCTATDGNHGRGVAWAARKLRQRAVIYMPSNTVPARIENIEAEGARVIVVDGNYDAAVVQAARDARRHNWQIISDTSWPGYAEIPCWIMAGYTTMFAEIHGLQDAAVNPDVVIVQAGVGALAAAASWYYNTVFAPSPVKLVSVEPTDADCLLESIRSVNGNPRQSRGKQDSIMAGLNCGTPSLVAWPFVKLGFDIFMTVSDELCIEAMRSYFYPQGGDPRTVSGESGAAGLAALIALCRRDSLTEAREALGLNSNATVLLLNTEGDTDPDSFTRLVKG